MRHDVKREKGLAKQWRKLRAQKWPHPSVPPTNLQRHHRNTEQPAKLALLSADAARGSTGAYPANGRLRCSEFAQPLRPQSLARVSAPSNRAETLRCRTWGAKRFLELLAASFVNAARGSQVCKRLGFRGFRFSLFRAPFPLGRRSCAFSTPPEAVSLCLCTDSLSWLTGAHDRPTPDPTTSTLSAYIVDETCRTAR